MAITKIGMFQTRKASKRKAKQKRNSELACGFDTEMFIYSKIIWCTSDYMYNMKLFAKLGIHCYNFEKGTNFKFMCCEKYSIMSTEYLDYYITFEAMDPAENSVQESELHENDWLHLFMELAFFFKLKCNVGDSPPLEINKVVIETKEDYITEAREKLKAEKAIFYISYKYKAFSQSNLNGDHKAIEKQWMRNQGT